MKLTLSSLIPKLIFFFFAWVYITTLTLSAFHIYEPLLVRLFFLVFVLSLVIWRIKTKSFFRLNLNVFMLILLVFFGLTFIQGLVSAPNTTDAMVYHLPRVMYWIQERTVFQAVKYTSHDYMFPFAEYQVSYLHQLLGSDRLAFLPQWLSFVGVTCLIYAFSRRIGANFKVAFWITLFTMSLPIMLLEATSTQTDLVMTFLLLFALLQASSSTVLMLLSVSFAFITKQVAAIFVLPVALYWWNQKHDQLAILFPKLLVGLLISVLIVGIPMVQNKVIYGVFLGQTETDFEMQSFFNSEVNIPTLISNGLRNLFIQLPLPVLGPILESNLARVIDLNNLGNTWAGSIFHIATVPIPQEDIAPAPLHIFVIIVGGVILLSQGKLEEKVIVGAVFLSFLLFSLILRWQPYNNRLTMSLIVLSLPVIAAVFWSKWQRLGKVITIFSVAIGLLVVLTNTSRPYFSYTAIAPLVRKYMPSGFNVPISIFLLPRKSQYYLARPNWESKYELAAERVAQLRPDTLGIRSEDGFTYPLWIEFRRAGYTPLFEPLGKRGHTNILIEKGELRFENEI